MSGMSDDDDFFFDLDDEYNQDDDVEPVTKRTKLAVETPVVDKEQQPRLSKPKNTPVYRAEIIQPPTPVRQIPHVDDGSEPSLSQLLRDPEFYQNLADAVRLYPPLFDCGHPRFRTNEPNRIKLWGKVAKTVHFRGSAADLEAEWKALAAKYREWYLERAQKKISSFDDNIEDVFLSMKWAQKKLIPWFERSPLLVALLQVKEKHDAKGVWPTKRRGQTAEEAAFEKSVYDVPEKEPAESPVRKRASRLSTGQTPRLEFPKRQRPSIKFPDSTTPKRVVRSPIRSRLRESTLRDRSKTQFRQESNSFSKVSNVLEISRDSGPENDVFSSPEKVLSECSSSPEI